MSKDIPSDADPREDTQEFRGRPDDAGASWKRPRVALYANTDWYLYNFRAPLIRKLVSLSFDILLICPPGKYSKFFSDFGVEWIPFSLSRNSYNFLTEVQSVRRLKRILDDKAPDIVHSFTLRCILHSALAVRSRPDIRAVHALTGLGKTFTSSFPRDRAIRMGLSQFVFPRLFREGDVIVVQNSSDAQFFVERQMKHPQSVRLIPGSGVDCEVFRPGARGFNATPIRILLAARLIRQKGIFEYIEMARDLRSRGEAIECLLAGEPDDGNDDSVTTEQIEEWVREGVVTWLGHVDDMASLFREVDVVVLPSYYGEGLPKSLAEAAASGLPIVTTDHPGCRDAVDDGSTGIIIPPRSAEALSQAVVCLARNTAMREKFSHAGRNKALADFQVESVNSRTIRIYDELSS